MPMCGWVLPCAHFGDRPQGTVEDVAKERRRAQFRAGSAKYRKTLAAEGGEKYKKHNKQAAKRNMASSYKKKSGENNQRIEREERVKAFEERIQRGEPGTSHLSPDTSENEFSDEDAQEK
uniref:Uncharacterized protein n=1 Tax=Ditylenchus dipsaci TaxID=166011 RepID=A0A915CTG3_9BILA